MNTQPEALRLIQHMDDEWPEDWDANSIRAELRRLHEVNQELIKSMNAILRAVTYSGERAEIHLAFSSPEIANALAVMRKAEAA
jgi:hypothetical protein